MNERLVRHSGKLIGITAVLTLLLVIPLLTFESRGAASQDPPGEMFDLQKDINQRFAPAVHLVNVIVESGTGDVLTQASLSELYRNEQRLRESDKAGSLSPPGLPAQSYLYENFDAGTGTSFVGVYSLADAVQSVLAGQPSPGVTLETATDEQVKFALHQLFSDPRTSRLKQLLAGTAHSEKRQVLGREIDYWESPAFFFTVLADNAKLGGGTFQIGVGGGQAVFDKEQFNRNVQEVLRGDQRAYNLWGVAIDLNLEAADEGQTAGLFIMLTVIAVILIAGLSLKSYWAVALTGAGLGALMIWLKGISSLVGLKEGLVVDFIVPIALISLGVDFALHALWRYNQEKSKGNTPRLALQIGFAGVLGALVLAMVSDSIAFLSNVSSKIEAVIHFGLAAGIAVVSSFFVLGIVVPLAMMHLEQLRRSPGTAVPRRARAASMLGSLAVAAATGAGVILLVAVSDTVGVAVILGNIAVFLGIPWLIARRRREASHFEPAPSTAGGESVMGVTRWFVSIALGIVRYRVVALLAVGAITVVATLFAVRLEATFDPKDFYDHRSDLVVGLDKVDQYFSEEGGEPGTIYVQGDLSNLDALHAIDRFIEALNSNPNIAKWDDGSAQVDPRNVTGLLRQTMASEYARSQLSSATGLAITDADGDGLPDSSDQVRAAITYLLARGLPLDQNMLAYTPGQVREVLYQGSQESEADVTILTAAFLGSREQQKVAAARESLTDDLAALGSAPGISRAGLTGSAFTRLAQLEASTNTLQRSVPIAAAATLVLLLVVMRSLRYAVVTMVPIGLVVAWLYGMMYLFGFALNFVTATIGAVSIGVGIDYSIHMTERFREELRSATSRLEALRRATAGTGMALLASAASSVVGFSIMGLAPMPMFSSYGILTAVMIFLALAASIVVLPSLLLLVTPELGGEKSPA